MIQCDQSREWISQMLDDELSEPQKTELMTHLAACADCARVYDAFAFLSASIDEGAEPPAELRANVMNAITAQSPRPKSAQKRRAVMPRLAALAACFAILIFAAAKMNPHDHVSPNASARSLETVESPLVYSAAAPTEGEATGTAAAQGESTQEIASTEMEPSPADKNDEGDAYTPDSTQMGVYGASALDVSVIRLFSGQVEEPRREPIMTATSEEALAAFLDLFAFSADTDSTLLTGDPVFVVRVTPVENDEYTISVWITDGKLYCVDDRDGMAYVAAGDASDLFAMIAEA